MNPEGHPVEHVSIIVTAAHLGASRWTVNSNEVENVSALSADGICQDIEYECLVLAINFTTATDQHELTKFPALLAYCNTRYIY